MSMMYCEKHNRHFDSDYDTECPECEDDDDLRDQAAERLQERIETHIHPSEGPRS